jgi:hypothetical protein
MSAFDISICHHVSNKPYKGYYGNGKMLYWEGKQRDIRLGYHQMQRTFSKNDLYCIYMSNYQIKTTRHTYPLKVFSEGMFAVHIVFLIV